VEGMKMFVRSVLTSLVSLLAVTLCSLPISAHEINEEDGVHRLALQISDNDPVKMTSVLNIAANVSRAYGDEGEEVEIKVIVFNAGIHMLRTDTSPIAKRLKSYTQSMPNVTFYACDNTLHSMARSEGKEPEIFDFAEHVTAGVVTLIQLNETGWTLVRP
jgi:uncharacterized protein